MSGGTFNLGRKSGDPDFAPGGLMVDINETPSAVATIASHRLDKYEVTVGRFRKFVGAYDAWRAAGNPAAGSGKHTHLPGGGLNAGAEPGWDAPSWNANVPATASVWGDPTHLVCNATTWTPNEAGNESRPINCVSWYEAYAFCIWDGGFLPSEAEWEYAARGGGTDGARVFPWSVGPGNKTIDYGYAVHDGMNVPTQNATQNVGSKSPGSGKFGQADLAGNVWEWALDWDAPYQGGICNNCAYLVTASSIDA